MKRFRIILTVLALCSLLTALCACSSTAPAAQETAPAAQETAPAATEALLSETEAPAPETEAPAVSVRHAEIEVEGYGIISLELDPVAAPLTVDNFVKLAQSGFYDGLSFHRIMDGFMIQGGDPNHDGSGGAEENIPGEFYANGWANSISHTKGVISMARAGRDNPYTGVKANDSASSQFFIMVADGPFLDGQYAAFGHVTEGIEIVEQIAKDARPIDNNGTIPYEQQPVINRVTILD